MLCRLSTLQAAIAATLVVVQLVGFADATCPVAYDVPETPFVQPDLATCTEYSNTLGCCTLDAEANEMGALAARFSGDPQAEQKWPKCYGLYRDFHCSFCSENSGNFWIADNNTISQRVQCRSFCSATYEACSKEGWPEIDGETEDSWCTGRSCDLCEPGVECFGTAAAALAPLTTAEVVSLLTILIIGLLMIVMSVVYRTDTQNGDGRSEVPLVAGVDDSGDDLNSVAPSINQSVGVSDAGYSDDGMVDDDDQVSDQE